MNYGASPFGGIPPVVKNLLIINAIFFFASIVAVNSFGIRIEDYLGLHVPMAEKFKAYQLITYMFLHDYRGIMHIFFNMFALFMFGRMLEVVWGPKRFLVFYFVTGIGAALVHLLTQYIEILPVLKAITHYMNNASHENLSLFLDDHLQIRSLDMKRKFDAFAASYNSLVNSDPQAAIGLSREYLYSYRIDFLNNHITVGASGAVFGILLAFGMLFPETRLMLLFPPIPIKAKYFVIIYGVAELFLGVANFSFDNVAHFAHLGGMLFGFILIKYWQKKGIHY
ncbi:rhomboid family intramembrane serine protease [Alkaliflexus imshenetskii]|uniref:rhomboid family intramembrane serine protease n=1 Tax=Alkaliflexus imshenetskii TaxID=286730 RepID=UPI0004798DC6|nr:rhomboid family intramembrane serine protease [Alkaliflexus imshenetskii]